MARRPMASIMPPPTVPGCFLGAFSRVVPARRGVEHPQAEPTLAPASMFVDDTGLATKGVRAVAEMQSLMAMLELWEPWSNIYLTLDLCNRL